MVYMHSSPHSTQLAVHMYMIHMPSGSIVDFFMEDKLFHPTYTIGTFMCVCSIVLMMSIPLSNRCNDLICIYLVLV